MPELESTEKMQYEKLIGFFEKLVTWTSVYLTFLISLFGYLFYSDRQSYQEEKTAIQTEKTAIQVAYNVKIADLTAEMNEFRARSNETILKTTTKTEQQITDLKSSANATITKIKISTNDLATQETERQLKFFFQQDRIQEILEKKVNQELKESVDVLVKSEIQQSSKSIIKITQFATQLSVGNYYANRDVINSFSTWASKEFPNYEDRQVVEKIYYETMREYDSQYFNLSYSYDLKNLNTFDKNIPLEATKEEVIKILERRLYLPENLHNRCLTIHILNRLTNRSVRCFEPF